MNLKHKKIKLLYSNEIIFVKKKVVKFAYDLNFLKF